MKKSLFILFLSIATFGSYIRLEAAQHHTHSNHQVFCRNCGNNITQQQCTCPIREVTSGSILAPAIVALTSGYLLKLGGVKPAHPIGFVFCCIPVVTGAMAAYNFYSAASNGCSNIRKGIDFITCGVSKKFLGGLICGLAGGYLLATKSSTGAAAKAAEAVVDGAMSAIKGAPDVISDAFETAANATTAGAQTAATTITNAATK